MRVLVLSDIHANLAALDQVLAHARDAYDEIWCLGDVVGYGPRPNECVERVRDAAALCVPGNHDLAVLDKLDIQQFNDMAREAILWTRSELTDDNAAFLATLAPVPVAMPHLDLRATHGSPRDPVSEYLVDLYAAEANWKLFPERYLLVGHTHLPDIFRWRRCALPAGAEAAFCVQMEQLKAAPGGPIALQPHVDHRVILNPGSVGQPRDKNNRASYALLDCRSMTWQYERVDYAIELTQSQMRAARLPRILIDRLSYGW